MKEELEFYDLKAKEKFKSSDYRIEEKPRQDGRMSYFAVAISPLTGNEAWRIVAEKFAFENA